MSDTPLMIGFWLASVSCSAVGLRPELASETPSASLSADARSSSESNSTVSLAARPSATVVVVLSEFGRTFRENGTRGTDHGHGSAYWVLGGAIQGGRMAGEQIVVAPKTLNQNRDFPLAMAQHFRPFVTQGEFEGTDHERTIH